ncbi:MAG TPA: hypothetical protein PLA57_01215 [Candidatus Paceibacterota bacterium]|nr:hypothetical protein [Candidatus Paceibacterota bacterium]HRS47839.1 hypothetical protein [Candidatus Paceibacterota bacterium]
MAQEEKNISEYFPNVSIRVMADDLKTIKESGGDISQMPKIEQPESSLNFLKKEEEKIAPPKIELPQETIVQEPQVSQEVLSQIPEPPKPASKTPKIHKETEKTFKKLNNYSIILIIAGAIFVISLILWLTLFRNQPSEIAIESPVTTPEFSITPPLETPSFQPSLVSAPYLINLKSDPNVKETRIELVQLDSQNFWLNIASRFALKQASSTIEVYSIFFNNQQLTSSQLLSFLIADPLASFKASIDDNYLIFSYWKTPQNPNLGVVFTIKNENLDTIKAVFQSWESTNIERDFKNLFLPKEFQQKIGNFQTKKISGQDVRELTIKTTSGDSLDFLYTFYQNYLIITVDEESFSSILKLL